MYRALAPRSAMVEARRKFMWHGRVLAFVVRMLRAKKYSSAIRVGSLFREKAPDPNGTAIWHQ